MTVDTRFRADKKAEKAKELSRKTSKTYYDKQTQEQKDEGNKQRRIKYHTEKFFDSISVTETEEEKSVPKTAEEKRDQRNKRKRERERERRLRGKKDEIEAKFPRKPHYMDPVKPAKLVAICNKLFDSEGQLQEALKNDFIDLAPITFPNKSTGKLDMRFQLAIKPYSKTFMEICALLNEASEGTSLIRTSEISEIKILIGGTSQQTMHEDIQLKQGALNCGELQLFIKSLVYSGLFTCDPQQPIQIAVSKTGLKDTTTEYEKIKKIFKDNKESCKASILHSWRKGFRAESLGFIFDGQVPHAGCPVKEGSPAMQEIDNNIRKKFDKKNDEALTEKDLEALAVEDVLGIKHLNSISRLFIATWPDEYRRCGMTCLTKENFVEPKDVSNVPKKK